METAFGNKTRFFLFITMLEFKQDDITAVLILTLTENTTLPAPDYLFVFTHVETKDTVSFVKAEIDDESLYPQRYNQFTIDPSVVFAGKQPGEWHYRIYEQDNATNLNPALSGIVLENGKLRLNRATEFAFAKYDSATSFKVYNG